MDTSTPVPAPTAHPKPPSATEAVETAWRIHGTLADWTGKVDAKAAFALSIESAALAGMITLAEDGHSLSRVTGALPRTLLWAGIVLVAAGLVLAIAVVQPRLNGRATRAQAHEDFIYFGHLRHWSPPLLEAALRAEEPLPALSRQLVVISQVVWRKHRLVRASLWSATAGGVLVTLAALLG